MKKLSIYLKIISIFFTQLSICYLGLITPFSAPIPSPTKVQYFRKNALDNYVVESPFTDAYGFYNLSTSGNSITDYLSNIEEEFSSENSTLKLKAPYLLYSSEENQIYQAKRVTTYKSGSTSEKNLDTYDTWSLAYNDQPYIVSSSDILIKGYHGNTFISNLSYTLSGNSASTSNKYYLQNLIFNISIPSNITSIRLYYQSINYSSSYHEVTSSTDNYSHHPESEGYVDKTFSVSFPSPNMFSMPPFTTNFTEYFGSPPKGSAWKSITVKSYDSNKITKITQKYVNLTTGDVRYEVQTQQRMAFSTSGTLRGTYTIPAYDEYLSTSVDTFIDGPSITTSNINLETPSIYFFPTYFLSTVNCSGRGDASDQALVVSVWDDLESVFTSLPNDYQSAFSNGTLDDPDLLSALTRYDYVVFYKNYGLTDFASRSNVNGRFYQKSEYHPFIKSEEDAYLVIIIAACSLLLISIVSLLMIRHHNKKSNLERR